ncbi:MAG: S41 family peptidase, partial [Firmicutes bacterium]|nr:S41 family peptidase [Bacillota bacterium]
MKKQTFLRILSYVLVALLSVTVSVTVMVAVLFRNADSVSKLDALESLILHRFIGEADQTAIEDAAASAMISALGDRWSYYLSAEDYQTHLESVQNAYVGIGVTVSANTDDLGMDVRQVTEDGPAQAAGLLAGDIITAVDGTDISGMTTTEVRNLIRGEAGTQVTLTLLRDGQTLTVSVTREEIHTAVATAQMLDGNIGLVTIVNFNSNCADETIAVIEELIDQGAEKLIFDVRYNPGGYASELVEVLDYLLPEGELFRTVDYTGAENVDYSDASCVEMPMAVLVNGDSYSAAEFFAAALSEYDWAIVVGEQTCGKGYFQNTFVL